MMGSAMPRRFVQIDTDALASENNKASNCSSGLLYFCLLCSNLRHFRSTHCFTVKWKSALDCTFLVQFLKNDCFFTVVNGFRFFKIIKQQLFDRFWDLLTDFLTPVSNSIKFLKNYSVHSTFCLHFTQFLLNSFESLTHFACLGLCSTQFCDFPFSLTL